LGAAIYIWRVYSEFDRAGAGDVIREAERGGVGAAINRT